MDENKQLAPKYINTPFAYTRTQKGLTLLQQHIMVRVSAHLQGYIKQFFQSRELMNSDEHPKPIMTKQDLEALPPVRVDLSEMGISSSTYSRVREALKKVLSVTLETDAFAEDGRPVKRVMFLFSEFVIPTTDNGTTVKMKVGDSDDLTDVQVDRMRGYVDIYLNKDAVFSMFDMNQGYVTHPENIARIGKVDSMPLIYYLVRHKMNNFKLSKAKITPDEIRDYLGMIKRDPIDGKITKVQYPQYSRLREKVVRVALDDIKRVYEAGQIDFYFDIKEVRPHGKKIGEPSYIEFRKVGVNQKDEAKHRINSEKRLCKTLIELYPMLEESKVKKAMEDVPDNLWDTFKDYAYNGLPKAVEQPHRWNGTQEEFIYYLMKQWIKQHQPKPNPQEQQIVFPDDKPGEKEWEVLLKGYKGALAAYLKTMTVFSYDGSKLILNATRQQAMEFEKNLSEEEILKIQEAMKKSFGKVVNLGYNIPKE